MRQTRKILVIIFHPQSRDDSIGMLLQLRREAGIRLRRQNLHGDRHVVDFLLGQESRMSDGDGVDEIFACFDNQLLHFEPQIFSSHMYTHKTKKMYMHSK